MDRIFPKTTNVFNVVSIARIKPHMYGPNGELLRTLEDVEDDAVRRASILNRESKAHAQSHTQHAEKYSDGNISEEKSVWSLSLFMPPLFWVWFLWTVLSWSFCARKVQYPCYTIWICKFVCGENFCSVTRCSSVVSVVYVFPGHANWSHNNGLNQLIQCLPTSLPAIRMSNSNSVDVFSLRYSQEVRGWVHLMSFLKDGKRRNNTVSLIMEKGQREEAILSLLAGLSSH